MCHTGKIASKLARYACQFANHRSGDMIGSIVSQYHGEILRCALRQVSEGAISIVRVKLFERGIDPNRRIIGEREAVQRKQHLFAAGQPWRLAVRISKLGRCEDLVRGLRRTIDLDLIRNGAGEARQCGLRMRTMKNAGARSRSRASKASLPPEKFGLTISSTGAVLHLPAATASAIQPKSAEVNRVVARAASVPSSRARVSSTGHLSRVRPSTMVITVSHTVCTRIHPCRRFGQERCRVTSPAPMSAERAWSTACRIVSISDSVSTSSFFATRGSASAR